MMKTIFIIIMCFFPVLSVDAGPVIDKLLQINNFHFVSEQLASSGQLKLSEYDAITDYGFKHVINLVPGDQQAERERATSLGLTYEQIEVNWSEPTLDDFERFNYLMHQYGQEKVYVHCELNYRASTFVYLYRVAELNVDPEQAKADLNKAWVPTDTWQSFIEKVLFNQLD